MKFDREATGGGAERYCTVENNRAVLEWKFYCPETEKQGAIRILVRDREGIPVLEGRQSLREEELFKAVLLHPHLWEGVKDPYLYSEEIFLIGENGEEKDRLERKFPIRTLREIPGKGWFLNGETFVRKAVRWRNCEEAAPSAYFQLFREAGVNTLCVPDLHRQPAAFFALCEKMGFLIWAECDERDCAGEKAETGAWERAGRSLEIADGSLFLQNGEPADGFYRCKARWSEEPFVYLSENSLIRQENGKYTITVYSNQKKTALYVDGLLFEFQSGEETFVFREIPCSSAFLCLTAEAGECAVTLAIHRTFTKASLFHDNFPIE